MMTCVTDAPIHDLLTFKQLNADTSGQRTVDLISDIETQLFPVCVCTQNIRMHTHTHNMHTLHARLSAYISTSAFALTQQVWTRCRTLREEHRWRNNSNISHVSAHHFVGHVAERVFSSYPVNSEKWCLISISNEHVRTANQLIVWFQGLE